MQHIFQRRSSSHLRNVKSLDHHSHHPCTAASPLTPFSPPPAAGYQSDYDDYYGDGSSGGWSGNGSGRSGAGMKSMGGKGWQSMTGHTVHMRGLPFRSTESDIIEVSG